LGFSGDRAGDAIGEEVMVQLNLSFEDLYSFSKAIEEEIARASIFLNIDERGG
jgi:hypothetical protein